MNLGIQRCKGKLLVFGIYFSGGLVRTMTLEGPFLLQCKI